MTEYNTLSAKLSNSQLKKSKLRIKSGTEVVLNFLSHDDSNDETHFPYKLLLNHKQVRSLRKAFGNNSSPNIKLSKTQESKISGGTVRRISSCFISICISQNNIR